MKDHLTSEQNPRLGEGFAFFAWHCALKDGYQDLSCDGYGRGRTCAILWNDLQTKDEQP